MKTKEKSQGNGQKLFGNWSIQIGMIAFALVWLAVVAANWAESAELSTSDRPDAESKASKAEPADSDYNFNWLDPEKKIYVLQNRRFTKANRFLLSVMVGPGLSNTYRTTFNVDPRIAYYFSEQFGIEGFYTVTSNSPNNAFTTLTSQNPTIYPVVREIKSQVGALVHWVPWYAKINVFNSIIYFDWYFALGVGSVSANVLSKATLAKDPTSTAQSYTAAFWSTGHQYHLNQNWTVRLDLTGAIYNAPQFGTTGDKSWYSNYNAGIGIGFRP